MSTQSRAIGRHADSFLIGFESSYGSAPADGYIDGAFYTHGLQEVRQKNEDPVLGVANQNDRDTARIMEGLPNLAGDLVAPVCLNFMGDLLRLVFGAPSSSGSDPYTHVFSSGADILPTASLQLPRRKSGGVTKYQGFNGVAANTMRISAQKADGVQQVSLGLVGRNEEDTTETVKDATPTARAYSPLAASLAAITLGGVSGRIRSIDLTYNNGLEVQNDMDGTPYPTGVEAGPSSLAISFTARYRDEAILDIGAARTEQALSLAWASGANSLTLAAPVVEIARRGAPVSGPGGLDLDFEVIARQSDTAAMLTATLVNGLAGSEYGA
jgi:hypothetical protein